MTPDQLAATLDALHWSQRTLARVINVDEATVRRWQRGNRPIPPPIADWLRRLAAAHASLPAPAAPERAKRLGRPTGGALYLPSRREP